MARNLIHSNPEHIAVACSSPATPTSGAPARFGGLTGVALIDERTDGLTTLDIGVRTWNLSCKAVDFTGSGGTAEANNAIAKGDLLYFVDGDSYLSKKATASNAKAFGYALETVTAGSTGTIKVLHVPIVQA